MANVLVIPNLLTTHMTTASKHSGAGSSSFTGVLSARKASLEQFADSLRYASSMGLAGVKSTSPMPFDYEVLEGIGALVLDEDQVDRQMLMALGAEVLDDVEIPAITPTPRASSEAPDFWHLDKIEISVARNQGLRGSGVLVGVLDTGIDASHPEFRNKTVHFAEFDAAGRQLSSGPRDAGAHGTHVCGLATGARAGVAPGADLAVAAVLTVKSPGGLSGWLIQIAKGLDWLIKTNFRGPGSDPGVDIVNASLGGTGYQSYLYRLLANARIAPGTLMVAAIGNGGNGGPNRHGSPGNYDIVVGVGATDRNDVVAGFSDWGTVANHGGLAKPDLCAPGVDVWSSIPGGGYASFDGTSMASPIACGVAALAMEKNPSFSTNVGALQREVNRLASVPVAPTHKSVRGRISLRGL